MKVKVKNLDLINAQGSMRKLFNFDFPAITALKLNKFSKSYISELTELNKVQNEKIKKYGIEDKEKKQWSIPQDSENYKTYITEAEELLESEVEIETYDLKLSHFKTMNFSIADIEIYSKFFTNDLE